MKKRFSIYHFLIAVLIFSMFTPMTSVFAKVNGDEEVTGSLTIYKFEQEPGTEKGAKGDGSILDPQPDGKPLVGVTFTFTQTHSYDPSTDEWTAANGTSFTKVTDDDGKIVVDPIPLGRYTVQETNGPDHVVLNEKEYSVDIPMTSKDGSSVNYDVHIYPKNETIRGSATLTKFKDGTEETLDGAVFKVFHKEGSAVQDEDGNDIELTSTNGNVTIDSLPFGDYYFKEIATVDGYLLNGEKVEFSINEQNASETVSLQNYSKPEVEKKVDKEAVNRGEKVTFTITVDLPQDIADYERFVITDVLHKDLEYVDGSQSGVAGFKFERDGQTLTWTATDFSTIEPGTVEITFDAKVSEDATANKPIKNKAKIDYNNGYEKGGDKTPPVTVTPTVGFLKVIKQDGDNEDRLSGAVFELRDLDGNVIKKGTTDDNGVINFGELNYGEYQLVETKAPAEYNRLKNPIDVTVNEDKQKQTIKVDNFKSGWDLPKTGGIGTTLFTAIGTILMATAFYLYTRRRKETA